jgi:tungstate transport system permease protein
MSSIVDAFALAVKMIFTGDPEVLSITARTLEISCSSTFFGALIFVPLGCLIHFNEFRGKRLLVNIIQTFYSLPTVFVGIVVYLVVRNVGPLGSLDLLFTPAAIVIGEVVLIGPIVTGLTISALRGVGPEIRDTAVSLGATRFQTVRAMLIESKFATLTAVLVGFGRAISEVGLALIVGGNIARYTRTLATGTSLYANQGEVERALALGIILIALALIVSILVNRLQQR